MGILFRKAFRIGPRWLHIKLNLSKTGASWSLVAGPYSWNTRSRRHRVDLPGPFAWQSRKN